MANQSIQFLERFTKLKYLKLDNVKNLKLDNLTFLKKNREILKIDFVGNPIQLKELNHLLECKCVKNVQASIVDAAGKTIKNCKIEILDENQTILDLPAENLKEITKNVEIDYMNVINIKFNRVFEGPCDIKTLRNFKKEIHVIIQDFACLDSKLATKIKNILKLDKIDFTNGKSVDIITFIEIRKEMEKIIEKAWDYEEESKQFLEVYRNLGQEFQLVENENLDVENKMCNSLQICEFLQNCLKCLHIKSNIIIGNDLEKEKKHFWNQVELEGKWYHADLSLDMENIKKNKVEYCLLSDKKFFETHRVKSGKNHYCAEDFNKKMVNVFFKTGLFRESFMQSYLEIFLEKIKKLFIANKKQEILALPEPKIEDEEN